MPATSPGRHAGGTRPSGAPEIPEPSYAERARTLVHLGRVGALSTSSAKHPGWPFGSVMPYGVDPQGRPLFLISSMAMHTHNLLGEPRAALLVTQPGAEEDPLGAARVTLMGKAAKVPAGEIPSARQLYLARYENAKYWVDFEDFAFFRMEIVDLYYVGGFGVMGWVAADDYLAAAPDPLADVAPDIISHMNADHADAMILLARVHAGLEAQEARITAVDRLGFHCRLETAEGMKGVRIAFPREVRSAQEARVVLVEMVKAARKATNST